MSPFKNNISFPIQNLIYMIMDHENGKIYEVSASFIRLMQILGLDDIK